jgi:hypothetical protein
MAWPQAPVLVRAHDAYDATSYLYPRGRDLNLKIWSLGER